MPIPLKLFHVEKEKEQTGSQIPTLPNDALSERYHRGKAKKKLKLETAMKEQVVAGKSEKNLPSSVRGEEEG